MDPSRLYADLRILHAAAVAMLAIGAAQPAAARAIFVTTTLDSDAAPAGTCTLRDAITAANTDSPAGGCRAGDGEDVVHLASGATYVLSVAGANEDNNATGDLDVRSIIKIQGNNSTIDANGIDRVFHVNPANLLPGATRLELHRLTVKGGDVVGHGGGILIVRSDVLGQRVAVVGNKASATTGGIGSRNPPSSLELHSSSVSNNTAGSSGGGVFMRGGQLILASTTVSGNKSPAGTDGAGIYVDGFGAAASVALARSVISGNSGASFGGGIAARTFGSTIDLTLDNTTVSGNTASPTGGGSGEGGGLHLRAIAAGGVPGVINATITGSRIMDNKAPRLGGGLILVGLVTNDTVNATLVGSTVSGNQVSSPLAYSSLGGGLYNFQGNLTLIGSIVACNEAVGNGATFRGAAGGIGTTVASGAGAGKAVTTLTDTIVADNLGAAGLGPGVGTFNLFTTNPSSHAETIFQGTTVSQGADTCHRTSGCAECTVDAIQTSLGNNVETADMCGFTDPTDLVYQPPLGIPLCP